MTIAAGFVCDGGIVMCADSQETYGDLKWNVEKLTAENALGYCPIMMSGAGFGDAIDSAIQRISDKLRGGFEHEIALEHIRDILRDIHENDLQFYPTDTQAEKQFELLIALKTGENSYPRLYKTTGSLIKHIPQYVVIGSGTLVNHSANMLYQRYMPLSHGVMLAVHLILLARSQLTSVGGRSKIATLDSAGNLGFVEHWQLPDTEGLFAEFLHRSGQLMLKCADPNFSKEDFSQQLASFAGSATRLKETQIENKEAWEKVWKSISVSIREVDKEEKNGGSETAQKINA